jgi:hypothetical protein
VFSVCLVIAAVPAQALPVVMQDNISPPDGSLYSVALGSPATTFPTTSADTTLSLLGTASTEYNSMGWRSDGFLYGIELNSIGGTGNYVKINPSNGSVISTTAIPSLPANWTTVRWDAGDVNNAADVLYIANTATVNDLYTLNLATGSLTSTTPVIISGVNYVADWAYNPNDGFLYGGDSDGDFVKLNPANGSTVSTRILASGEAYGAAWYDPTDGDIYVYRNSPTNNKVSVYQVDLDGTPTLVSRWGATGTFLNDGAYVAPIPEPATLLLLGTGLIGFAGIRRKNRT